eukprot:scaffold136832_cov160-Phaeocystis_antarctica.AAC.1
MSGRSGRRRCALHGAGLVQDARWLRSGAQAARGAGLKCWHAAAGAEVGDSPASRSRPARARWSRRGRRPCSRRGRPR